MREREGGKREGRKKRKERGMCGGRRGGKEEGEGKKEKRTQQKQGEGHGFLGCERIINYCQEIFICIMMSLTSFEA